MFEATMVVFFDEEKGPEIFRLYYGGDLICQFSDDHFLELSIQIFALLDSQRLIQVEEELSSLAYMDIPKISGWKCAYCSLILPDLTSKNTSMIQSRRLTCIVLLFQEKNYEKILSCHKIIQDSLKLLLSPLKSVKDFYSDDFLRKAPGSSFLPLHEVLNYIVIEEYAKNLKNRLNYLEWQNRLLINNISDLVFITDFKGNIFEANLAAKNFFKFLEKDIFGYLVEDLIIEDSKENYIKFLNEIRDKKEIIKEDIFLRTDDQKKKKFRLTISSHPNLDKNERLILFFSQIS